jgi:serine/threonine protein kinase
MPLKPSTRLGPYEILSTLGAGGMGEVYRARDTRLDRTVAIKILHEHLSDNPQFHERFEREARAISRLSHPNICPLYDVGQQDGVEYLVMEYLEGETMAARLHKGPVPPDQALQYAIQIADALDTAHRHGVVHRDLKPGNIMLTKSGVKLLDFGLAKVAIAGTGADVPALATQTASLTSEGTIIGTLQYMAPEQLQGIEADARTDLFAFGAVLYEMATGRKAFEGKSQASLLAAILEREPPPISTLQPLALPALEYVVRMCLAKDPEARWQTAHDVLLQLKWIAEARLEAGIPKAMISRRERWKLLAWAPVGAVCLAALLLAVVHLHEKPVEGQSVRFQVSIPDRVTLDALDFAVLSPNGRYMVFSGVESPSRPQLWIYSLDSLVTQPLRNTEGAWLPFWSPDSRFVGFFASGKLKKVDILGGAPETLCDAGEYVGGGSWSQKGVILFVPQAGSLHRVSAGGGEAKPALELDKTRKETEHLWPYFLPDGRHFLYLSRSTDAGKGSINVASLGNKVTQRLISVESNVSYTRPGFLIYGRQETLMAQPFDAGRLRITGDPFPIAERVLRMPLPGSLFSISQNGILAYRSTSSGNAQLAWYSREGNRLGTVGEPADYSNPMISPDQKRVAVSIRDPQTKTRDIWVIGLQRGGSSRLTFDPGDDTNPAWSPDSARIAFSSDRKGHRDIYVKSASGAGEEQVLLQSSEDKSVEDWSPDGQYLVYNTLDKGRAFIYSLRENKVVRFLLEKHVNPQIRFCPTRGSMPRWFAYTSSDSESPQVYVRRFGGAFSISGGEWQISTHGGSEPTWRGDGKELFYANGNKLMAIDVKPDGESFEKGINAKHLFDAPLALGGRSTYAVATDGKRFLMNVLAEDKKRAQLTVVLNWRAGLRK